MLLYSIVAGTGLGLMYVPAVVAVGYYFDKRRAFATGKYFSLPLSDLKKYYCSSQRPVPEFSKNLI